MSRALVSFNIGYQDLKISGYSLLKKTLKKHRAWKLHCVGGGGMPGESPRYCEMLMISCPEEEYRLCTLVVIAELRRLRDTGAIRTLTPPRGFLLGWKAREL